MATGGFTMILTQMSGVAPANQTEERPIRKRVREFGVF